MVHLILWGANSVKKKKKVDYNHPQIHLMDRKYDYNQLLRTLTRSKMVIYIRHAPLTKM